MSLAKGKTAATLVLTLALVAAAAGRPTAAPPASGSTATPDAEIETEDGLRRALDALDLRYEPACRKMGSAVWALMASEPGSSRDAVASARRDLSALFRDPLLHRVLAHWGSRRTVTTDPTLSRRVFLWSRAGLVAAADFDPEISALADDLAARIGSARFTFKGRQIARDELIRILERDPDAAARKEAWKARATFAASIKKDVQRLLRLRALKARDLQTQYYHHLVYAAQDLDPYWVYNTLEAIRLKTRPAFGLLAESLKQSLDKAQLDPWDLEFAIRRRTAAETIFPAGGADSAMRKLISALGFQDSPAWRVQSLSGSFPYAGLDFGIAIPSDTRVLMADGAGTDGAGYYDVYFREHALALQFASTRQSAPMLKGYQWIVGLRNLPYSYGVAGGLAAFLRDPLFLTAQLGVPQKEAENFLVKDKERRLFELQRLLLEAGMEFTAYANPDADLDARYRELFAKAFDVALPPGEAVPWQDDIALVAEPLHSESALVALTVEVAFQTRIRALFGDAGLTSGKVAAWLIENCYAEGESLPLGRRLAGAIEGGMDFDAYLETLGIARPRSRAQTPGG